MGSTYRVLGRYTEAEATLCLDLERFPQANEMKVFLAMTLHNLGQSKAAFEYLLTVLAETSSDRDIQAYRPPIVFYARYRAHLAQMTPNNAVNTDAHRRRFTPWWSPVTLVR